MKQNSHAGHPGLHDRGFSQSAAVHHKLIREGKAGVRVPAIWGRDLKQNVHANVTWERGLMNASVLQMTNRGSGIRVLLREAKMTGFEMSIQLSQTHLITHLDCLEM